MIRVNLSGVGEYFHHLAATYCWGVISLSLCFPETSITAMQLSESIKTHLHKEGSKYSWAYQFSGCTRWDGFEWHHGELLFESFARQELSLGLKLKYQADFCSKEHKHTKKSTFYLFKMNVWRSNCWLKMDGSQTNCWLVWNK